MPYLLSSASSIFSGSRSRPAAVAAQHAVAARGGFKALPTRRPAFVGRKRSLLEGTHRTWSSRAIQTGSGAGAEPVTETNSLEMSIDEGDGVAESIQPPPNTGLKLQPLKLKEAILSVALGLIIRFAIPCPEGVTMQAWSLLSIFISTIAGIVLNPLPVGAWAFYGLTAAIFTKTLTFQQAFSAFTNEVIWMIVTIFFIARGFVKTGLGDRAGYFFAKIFGKTTLGLAYGLVATEAMICPGMPSCTARHGGVMLPIIASLSRACGSDPANGTQSKMGAYLVTTVLHTGTITGAMYMTGAAQNLLCNKLAGSIGVPMATWGSWFQAAVVPGVISILLTPLILYKIFPPEVKETPNAPIEAAAKLKQMGPMATGEKIVLCVMACLVVLWVGGSRFGVPAPVAAMLGLCALIGTGVLSWQDCLQEKGAWDTLMWFAVLVGMSGMLEQFGLISYIASLVSSFMAAASMPWYVCFGLLHAAYFGIHYLFASQTAQVGALYVAFLAMMTQAGAPPMLSALTLSFSTSLFGAITHYASAHGAIYYGAGFIDMKTWWRLGITMSAFIYGIWIVTGIPWWTALGLLSK